MTCVVLFDVQVFVGKIAGFSVSVPINENGKDEGKDAFGTETKSTEPASTADETKPADESRSSQADQPKLSAEVGVKVQIDDGKGLNGETETDTPDSSAPPLTTRQSSGIITAV